jgi:proteic killer suppression protein
VIKSFKSKDTARLFNRLSSRRWRDIAGTARRKLEILNAAKSLAELRVPPGNRLAALKADRRGQYSIRINDRWRICFIWRGGDAHDVEIVDYH